MNEYNRADMTPAEFKTAHEALGVSTAFLADRIGVSSGRIWEYESPNRRKPVPDHAAEIMRELVNTFDTAAERLAAEVKLGGSEFVPRYADLERFEAAVPELAGWGALTQGLLVAQVQRDLRVPVEYV